MAGIQVAVAAAVDAGAGGCNRCHRRRRGVDLQDAGRVGHRARQGWRCCRPRHCSRPVQVERRHRKVAGVLAGTDRVAEGQRIAAGAAAVARRSAIVERQRRHPAGNRHRLAHIDGERDDMARIQVAIAAAVDPAARCHNR